MRQLEFSLKIGTQFLPGPILSTEIDHEIISTAILLPSADSSRVVVSYKRKYVHKVHLLVNGLVKLDYEKNPSNMET